MRTTPRSIRLIALLGCTVLLLLAALPAATAQQVPVLCPIIGKTVMSNHLEINNPDLVPREETIVTLRWVYNPSDLAFSLEPIRIHASIQDHPDWLTLTLINHSFEIGLPPRPPGSFEASGTMEFPITPHKDTEPGSTGTVRLLIEASEGTCATPSESAAEIWVTLPEDEEDHHGKEATATPTSDESVPAAPIPVLVLLLAALVSRRPLRLD